MISKVKYKGDLRTEAVHLGSGSAIVTDAPVDNQGKGEAFSPTDLVATALGSCMLTIMGIVAKRDGIDIEDATAEVEKIMSKSPRRIGEIKVRLIFKGPLNDIERGKLERAARTCPVSGSLHDELKETIEFVYE
ncbi:MAG: OsmC family protein [Candidatus Marinimicrobia bacterium]|jgi:uncharacterized OsmC-like protein|nr:OsmC family protein [Candidatus Neomarinimicrobiota bacterium]|tara:strand:+ start:998 stop:1399 length:402 start_codon:yes stop_codon:yes gene_type:complete